MKKAIIFGIALLGLVVQGLNSQSATYSPLGVLVSPAKAPTLSLRIKSQLPKGASPRFDARTNLGFNGEEVVIYAASTEQYEPHEHIAIFCNAKKVVDITVSVLFGGTDNGDDENYLNYEFYKFAEFSAPAGNAAAFAFRNIGDGAGTLIAVIVHNADTYSIAYQGRFSQAELKYFEADKTAEVWASNSDGDCVWCPQHYKVMKLKWSREKLVLISKFDTKHALSPYIFSEQAIKIVKAKPAVSVTQ
jgi:hypothetical protein